MAGGPIPRACLLRFVLTSKQVRSPPCSPRGPITRRHLVNPPPREFSMGSSFAPDPPVQCYLFSPSTQATYRKASAENRIWLSNGAKVAKTMETLSPNFGKRFEFSLRNGKIRGFTRGRSCRHVWVLGKFASPSSYSSSSLAAPQY